MLPLLVLVHFIGAVLPGARASKFSRYTNCSSCIKAGYGWSLAKSRCGAFVNTVCPEPSGTVHLGTPAESCSTTGFAEAWLPGPNDLGAWKRIETLQVVASVAACGSPKIVSSQPKHSGLITVLSTLGVCMGFTIAKGQQFVIDESKPRGVSLGNLDGFEMKQFMVPISTCAATDDWNASDHTLILHRGHGQGRPDNCYKDEEEMKALKSTLLKLAHPFAELPDWQQAAMGKDSLRASWQQEKLKLLWWHGMVMRWMLRPNEEQLNWLSDYSQKIGFPIPGSRDTVIAVHIRGGDKAKEVRWTEHLEEFGATKYFEKVFELRQKTFATNQRLGHERWPIPTVLFLATDEASIVGSARADFDKMLATEKEQTPALQQKVSFRLVFDTKVVRHHSMAGYLTRASTYDHYISSREVLTDTMLLASSYYMIGTCTSTVSVVSAQMQIVKHMTAAPTEADGTLTRGWHMPIRIDKEQCKRRRDREHQEVTFADDWVIR